MLRSSLLKLGVVLALGSVSACDGDPDIEVFSVCTAALAPVKWRYLLDGDVLEIGEIRTLADGGMLEESTLTREGTGEGLYDAWLAGESTEGDLSGRTVVTFGMNKITVTSTCERFGEDEVTVEVSGRALIDDTTIEILDTHLQQKKF